MMFGSVAYERKRLRLIGRLAIGPKVLDIGYAQMPNPSLRRFESVGVDLERPSRTVVLALHSYAWVVGTARRPLKPNPPVVVHGRFAVTEDVIAGASGFHPAALSVCGRDLVRGGPRLRWHRRHARRPAWPLRAVVRTRPFWRGAVRNGRG